MRVKVLLSTYNGAHFLGELLDSAFAQEDTDVEVVVRDDGSTDGTLEILKDYAEKTSLTFTKGNNMGWRNSFMTLLNQTQIDDNVDFYALADQDDVWLPDKLKAAIDRLHGIEEPAVYHSNVILADGHAKPLGDRFPRTFIPTQALPMSFFDVTWLGTTMVFNPQLMQLVQHHAPVNQLVHDAYVIALAQFMGRVIYDPEPHLLYRRHGASVTGFGESESAQKIKAPSLMDRYRRYKKNPFIHPFSKRAAAILDGFRNQLSDEQISFLSAVADYQHHFPSRLRLLFDPRIRATGLRQTLQIKYRVLANTL